MRVGDEPREREDGGLRHGVVRHPHRRPLPRRRGHVHDGGVLGRAQVRQRGPDRADVAHHVRVPGRLPVGVRARSYQVATLATPRLFTSTSRPPSAAGRRRDGVGRAGLGGEISRDRHGHRARRRPWTGSREAIATRAPPATRLRAVARPMPALPPVTSARMPSRRMVIWSADLMISADDPDPARAPRRDRLESRGPLAGPLRPAPERHRASRRRRRSGAALRARGSTRSTRATSLRATQTAAEVARATGLEPILDASPS